MKKAAAIFLFILYLFGSTEAYQLLKLPMLVQHYIKHEKEQPGISLLAFLKMHYSKNILIDDDWQQDMKLPFKTHDSDVCMMASVSLPSHRIIFDIVPPPVVSPTFVICETNQYSFLSLQDIFQPPKSI